MTTDKFDCKIAVVGKEGIGKSTFIIRFVHEYFVVDYDPTITDEWDRNYAIDGLDYHVILYETHEYDLRESWYVPSFFTGNVGYIFVYAIDNRKSFEGLDCLMEMILKKNHEIDFRKFPCCLIGTKMDKEKDRQVTRDEGITFASERGFDFFEVNSKQRVNIDEVFVKLCPRVYEFGGRPPVASNKSLCKTQ